MRNDVLWSWISVSSSVDVAQKASPAVSHLLTQTCLRAALEALQRRRHESKRRNDTASALLLCKNKGQRLQQCVEHGGVSAPPLMFWQRKLLLSALWLSIGKMIDFLLELFWYQVVVTWEGLIHKLWVGNREGGEIWFWPWREETLTVQLCSGLNKRNSAHVVFISDAPLKCFPVLGL